MIAKTGNNSVILSVNILFFSAVNVGDRTTSRRDRSVLTIIISGGAQTAKR